MLSQIDRQLLSVDGDPTTITWPPPNQAWMTTNDEEKKLSDNSTAINSLHMYVEIINLCEAATTLDPKFYNKSVYNEK